MHVSLIIDTGKFPELADKDIQMRNVSRKGEKMIQITAQPRTLTFTVPRFIVFLVLTACTWGLAWCILNAILGNYSTGAKIFDWIFKKCGFSGFIR